MTLEHIITLLVILQLAQLAGLLLAAHHIYRTRVWMRGNGKEKKPNGQWPLDMHDYRNLQAADKMLLDRLTQIEALLRHKFGDNWPFIVARD